jgi:hypothetical membrane protein
MADRRSWRRLVFILAMIGCIQFIVLTTAAMFVYPGGTHTDNSTSAYLFQENFFSDLGRTVAHSGETNTASMVLFVTALSLGGLVLILFFLAVPHHFRHGKSIRRLSVWGSVFGFVSGISFVGIAAVPSDINLTLHRILVDVAFVTLLVVVACYSSAIMKSRIYPRRYAMIYLGFALVLALYLVLLFAGPSLETESGLRIQAIGQKIVVYAAITCMFAQSWGGYRLDNLTREVA